MSYQASSASTADAPLLTSTDAATTAADSSSSSSSSAAAKSSSPVIEESTWKHSVVRLSQWLSTTCTPMVAAAVAVLLLVAILVAFTGAKGGGKGNTATASGSAALIAADETLLLSSPSSSDSAAAATAALTPCQRSNFTATTLKTATEQSMVALFPRLHGQKKFEASDVIRVGQYYYVVYDNLYEIGRIHHSLGFNSPANVLLESLSARAGDSGFECIVHDPRVGRSNDFYVFIESVEETHYHARTHSNVTVNGDAQAEAEEHSAAEAAEDRAEASKDAAEKEKLESSARTSSSGKRSRSSSDSDSDAPPLPRFHAYIEKLVMPVPPDVDTNGVPPSAAHTFSLSARKRQHKERKKQEKQRRQQKQQQQQDADVDAADTTVAVVEGAIPSEIGDVHAATSEQTYMLEERCKCAFSFESGNKGFEGAEAVIIPNASAADEHAGDGELVMLGLCEGNFCAGGRKGRTAGNGRIVVMRRNHTDGGGCLWATVRVIAIPPTVAFVDYSAMSMREIHHLSSAEQKTYQVVISSQESSQVWLGQLRIPSSIDSLNNGAHDWQWVGEGRVLDFPRLQTEGCEIEYCNIEGVAFVDEHVLIAVSDKMKGGGRQPARCLQKDQSIHAFVLP